MQTDLADCSASELHTLYSTQAASPVEATQAVLARIGEGNAAINAFRLVDESAALDAARRSEQRWQAGAPASILDGVPVSIKDLILTKGWSTLRGSRTVDPDQAWEIDAPASARLRESGAVLLGKTTTPEFGCKGVTDSYLTGVTRNPWNLEKSAGGSSGGSAAAVAAGMGPLALGTDGAGSIRIPSAFCGVVGFKASFGRVPAWPPSPFGSVAHVGPHARSVEDAARLLTVIAAADPRDWTALPYREPNWHDALDAGAGGLRIAYSANLGYAEVDPEIARATRHCADLLAAHGAIVEAVDPGFADPLDLICALWFLGAATLVDGIAAERHSLLDPMLLWQAEQGLSFSAVQINRLQMRRAELGTLMRLFHRNYDVLLTPALAVSALPALPTGAMPSSGGSDFLGWTPFSYPFNLTQQPAIVLPCGLTEAGLPMSVQLVGGMHEDALVLKAARALEAILPPFSRAPRIAR